MKGVTLICKERDDLPDDGDFSFTKDGHFEDKHDTTAYSEALTEIFNKHNGIKERMILPYALDF